MAAQVRRLTLEEEYTARCPTSAELYRRAVNVFPSGVTHDSRYVQPHPVYISRGHGSRAWDVDGNEYVDYWSGHGALLLGHCHPAIMAAVSAQLQKGTHYGGSTELEVRWGELVQQIVPSAERVKFFSSGTEATMMAMRLARAYTGKSKIVKIQGHFHGWHDYATVAMQPPWEVPISAGVPQETASTVLHVPFKDIEALRQLLAARDDIAGVIMLCNGAGTEYLRQVRDLTRQHGVVLIFDEVVTGFRYAPGGAQEYFGVTPDLTALAKILAGGLPGGAVAGKKEIMALLEFRDDPQWLRFGRINHPGTFNANPLSAAAGIACLEIVRHPEIQRTATAIADQIRAGFTEVARRQGVAVEAGGEVSLISLKFAEPRVPPRVFNNKFRIAMALEGINVSGPSLIVSAVHTPEDVERTVAGFERALERLRADGALP
jgi:glutamate-1-semialdehyde 2,1-aminomutase